MKVFNRGAIAIRLKRLKLHQKGMNAELFTKVLQKLDAKRICWAINRSTSSAQIGSAAPLGKSDTTEVAATPLSNVDIQGDLNTTADMEIQLNNVAFAGANDFVL